MSTMHQSQIQDDATDSDSPDDAPKNPYYNPETNKNRVSSWVEHYAGQYGCNVCRKPGTGMFVSSGKKNEPKLVFSEPNPISLCCDEGKKLYSEFLEYGANTSKPGVLAWGFKDWFEDNSLPQK